MTHLAAEILNNSVCLGIIGFALVMLPIIGIAKIHEPPNESNRSRPSSDTETVPGDD